MLTTNASMETVAAMYPKTLEIKENVLELAIIREWKHVLLAVKAWRPNESGGHHYRRVFKGGLGLPVKNTPRTRGQ